MKNSEEKNTFCRKIKSSNVSLTAAPLLRFKHQKRKSSKKKLNFKRLGEVSPPSPPSQMLSPRLSVKPLKNPGKDCIKIDCVKQRSSMNDPRKCVNTPSKKCLDMNLSDNLQRINLTNEKSPVNVKPSIVKMPLSNSANNIFQLSCEENLEYEYVSIASLVPTDEELHLLSSLEHFYYEEDDHHNFRSNCKETNVSTTIEKRSSNVVPNDPQKNKTNQVLKFDNNCSKECIISVKSSDEKSSSTLANMYELSGSKCLLVIKPESSLYLVGVIEVELLKGSVEILGYNLNRPKQKLLVFSLQGSSHLFIKSTVATKNLPLQNLGTITSDELVALGLSEQLARKVVKNADKNSFLVLRRKKSHSSSSVWPLFFENHLSYSVFPPTKLLSDETRPCHKIEEKVDCIFEGSLHELGFKELNQIPEWSVVEQDLISQDFPRTVLCGGKSVGKSTLLRYLINKSLEKWGSVLVLDFDIGQCEFTLAGCLSVVKVEEPVLGPNYSHLKEPLRSVFLGEVDVTKCPESYIGGCKLLIDFAKQHHASIPWLINTMGFTKGFGISLTCGIIKNIKPTNVVQIESKDRKLNFPSGLSPTFVESQNIGAFSVAEECVHYKLYIIPSGAEKPGNNMQLLRGIRPAEARNLVVLAYLSDVLKAEGISNLSQVIPYKIDMEVIELRSTSSYKFTRNQVAASMNGNMIALCSLMNNNLPPNCLGFGIVRGIDWQSGTMFIITPMPIDKLKRVNCLVKGNIGIPESLYYNQGDQVMGHVPYVAHTSGKSTSRFARRDYRSLAATQKEGSRNESSHH